MKKIENPDFPYYVFEGLSRQEEILHFVSSGAKDIGFGIGKDAQLIVKNRKALAKAVGFEAEQLVTAHQVHGASIAVVGVSEKGKGALDRDSRIAGTDALITNLPGICLMVLSADCVPVLLCDPVRRAIAAVHSGWRGTAADIAGKTVLEMQIQYGCKPEDIQAGIGASIGPCCFEVDGDVAGQFEEFPHVVLPGRYRGKYQVNLWEANRLNLLNAGLKPEHIEMAQLCSVCHPEHFFSFRRDKEKAGRFGAGIGLKG